MNDDGQLWDQVDGVITVAAQLGGMVLSGPELAIELGQVQAGRLGAVVVVPVHVEHFLALYAEQATQHAFRQSSPQNDLPVHSVCQSARPRVHHGTPHKVVFFIHLVAWSRVSDVVEPPSVNCEAETRFGRNSGLTPPAYVRPGIALCSR